MGFYAPAQIVRDAREHGVEVRAIDVTASEWDCVIEDTAVLQLGFRLINGFSEEWAERLVIARHSGDLANFADLVRVGLPRAALVALAEADALRG
jgi:error-prone DNA polymerase